MNGFCLRRLLCSKVLIMLDSRGDLKKAS